MANPLYLASLAIPMTEKPSTAWEPMFYKTYEDIFRIQNTVRMILTDFVEDAPADGKRYVRQNNQWVEIV